MKAKQRRGGKKRRRQRPGGPATPPQLLRAEQLLGEDPCLRALLAIWLLEHAVTAYEDLDDAELDSRLPVARRHYERFADRLEREIAKRIAAGVPFIESDFDPSRVVQAIDDTGPLHARRWWDILSDLYAADYFEEAEMLARFLLDRLDGLDLAFVLALLSADLDRMASDGAWDAAAIGAALRGEDPFRVGI